MINGWSHIALTHYLVRARFFHNGSEMRCVLKHVCCLMYIVTCHFRELSGLEQTSDN